MELIVQAINAQWWWLGPWLLASFGVALILLVVEIIGAAAEEMRK